MSLDLIRDTQGIKGYEVISTELLDHSIKFYIKKSELYICPACGSHNVSAVHTKDREFIGLPTGSKKTIIKLKVHRIRCKDCGKYRTEEVDFIDSKSDRITHLLSKCIIHLRCNMCISAVANFFDLHWWTVKNIEKKSLKKEYAKIDLSHVTTIGIDEVFMGKSIGVKGYLTIVRDLKTGAVLYIGDGKAGSCLDGFKQEVDKYKAKITTVAVDLSAAFTAWIKTNLSDSTIVYDHFHIIKLMNEKINNERRKTMNSLEELEKKELRNRMWHYICNKENLNTKATEELRICNILFDDLGTAYWLKESLRNIYKICDNSIEAKLGFERWCELAYRSGVAGLKTMAKTIEKSLDGIISYWTARVTSASMEGFNNKIGWLTRQAYGYRDQEYLKLKIFALPKLKKQDLYLG